MDAERPLFNLHLAEAQSQCILGNELVSDIMCIECADLNIYCISLYQNGRPFCLCTYPLIRNSSSFLSPSFYLPPCVFCIHLPQKQRLGKSINGTVHLFLWISSSWQEKLKNIFCYFFFFRLIFNFVLCQSISKILHDRFILLLVVLIVNHCIMRVNKPPSLTFYPQLSYLLIWFLSMFTFTFM